MPVGRAAMDRNWSLTITSLRPTDQGIYVCVATNSAGTYAANTSLIVVGKFVCLRVKFTYVMSRHCHRDRQPVFRAQNVPSVGVVCCDLTRTHLFPCGN